MGHETETIRTANGAAWRRWLTGLIALVAVSALGFFLLGGVEGISAKLGKLSGRGADGTASPADVMRSPQVVCDETLTIGSGGSQGRGFELPSARPVQVEITGIRDTAKGFSVFCIDPADFERFSAGQKVPVLAAFRGQQVSSMKETHRMAAGRYMIVVNNSQNILNSLQVKLRITVDPD